MKKLFLLLALIAFFLQYSIFAKEIKIKGNIPNHSILLNTDKIKSDINKLTVLDPHFKDLGIQNYAGISIENLLKMIKAKKAKRLIFIALDQYVVELPIEPLIKNNALIAFESGDKPIQPKHGGPLKLVFDNNYDAFAWCWYIDTIVVDNYLPSLKIEKNKKIQNISRDKINQMSHSTIPIEKITLTRGFWKKQKNVQKIVTVNLNDILPNQTIKSATLVPLVGPSIQVNNMSNYKIAFSFNENIPFTPTMGGPFLGINAEKEGPYDASKIFLFLEKIIINE